jgi:AcrR family transcriptional regulator
MAGPSNAAIRARLREQAVDYVLSHGVADLALRPLAKVLKTNARMLIYHFGSREGLMSHILAGLREREDARIQTWFQDCGKTTYAAPSFSAGTGNGSAHPGSGPGYASSSNSMRWRSEIRANTPGFSKVCSPTG